MLPVVGLFKTWHWVVGCLSFYKSPTASSSKHSWQCRPSYPSLLAPCRKHQKYIAQILLASYFSMPGVLLAQGATAANTAHAPSFDTAANGVPIVNINAPSAKGVSRNEYDQFNVDAKGLILNNSTSIVQTQLAGYVDGNKHLGGKSASIILNEVMGNSRSALNGYMEIAGQRAQLIIANQHGITCNGCGFINTSRGMLTTGASVFDAFGNLSGFDVSRGDVDITGLGFNDTETDEVDILARSVSLNADMWANQATIITGDNVINYNDKSVTSRSTGEKTGFSLDVAAIGGMYANRIRLIGTEKGLGVNLSGKVSGTESMVLDTQGNLVNKVSLSSKQLSVNANNITNTGDLLGDKIILTANDLENTGSKANIQASNTLNMTLQGTLNNQDSAKIQTPNGLLTLNANLVNNQSTLAANQLTLIATQLDNHTQTGSIFGTDKVDLTLTGALNNRDSALIQSDKQLVIHADGNITNRNATLGSMGAVTISSQNLTNSGTVSAQNDTLSVTSDSVNNNGGLAGTRVTINANDINNTGSHAFVLAKEKFEIVSTGGLNNTDGGVFYSLGDGEFDVAGILTNSSATIETHNDLTIKASKVSNRKRAFSASESVSSQAYNNVGIGVPGGYYQASRSYTQTTTTPYIATDSPQAYLLSGGDMTITGAIDNLYSTVSAVGNLNFTASQLNNQFYRANKTIVSSGVDTLYRNETYCKRKVGGHCISERQRTKIDTRGYNNTSASTVTLASSTFTAGGNITGKVGSVDNKGKVGEVEKAIASKDPLPSASDEGNDNTLTARHHDIFKNVVDDLILSALYGLSTTPNPPFLIETNPLLTNYQYFISSDYLLNKLTSDAAGRNGKVAVRLGDGFLEQKLVRDQILSYTGFQTLPDETDIEAMYALLMNNAVDSYEDLGLSTGIELSAAQIAQLQQPIVWMVTETVDTPNGPQQALVPKVYFSAASGLVLRPDGALIAATNINIDAQEGITNSGSMLATADLSLKGRSIDNAGTVKADGNGSLTATSDITNSGTMQAGDTLGLVAGGNIISETKTTVLQHQRGGHKATETLVGDTASLQGTNIRLSAGNDISLIGSDVTASDQVNIDAENNVSLASLAVTNSSQDGHIFSRSITENQVSSVSGNNIQLSAGNTLTSEGAQINAQDNLALSATNIDLLAVTDSKDDYSFLGGGGNSTEKRTHNETLTGTALNAGGTLSLVSQQDIFSKGSTLSGGEGIALAAGGDVILASAVANNASFEEVKTKSSGFWGSKKSTKTTTTQSTTNQGTNLASGGDINITSGANILLSGTKATANGNIDLEAEGDIQLLSAVDQTSSRYQEQKKGSFKVKTKDQGSIKQTAVTSELFANGTSGQGNITLKSGNNINLEGATLAANDTLFMGAGTETQEVVTKDANGHYVNAEGTLAGNVTVGTQALQNSEWNESSSGYRGILKDVAKSVSVVASNMGMDGEIKVGESHATRTDTLKQQTSTLAANDLNIDAKNDVALIGANVAVTDTATINANNVTIDAAQERTVTSESHTDHTISSEGATLEKDQISLVSLTETKQTEKATTTANTWAGSNISAGNLNINAKQNVAIIASDIKVKNNADITGENILVGGREATTDTTHDSITETKTLTVGVRNAYVDVVLAIQALKDAKKAIGAAKDAYNEAKQKVADGKLPKSDLDFYKVNLAAATANVASATTAVTSAGATAAASTATYGFTINGGVATQTDTTSTTRTQGTWNGSNITVGGNTSLTSNNNLNIEGSNIDTAGQLALNAKKINITAGTNTVNESTESRSEGASASYGSSGGVGGGVNASQSNSDSQSTQYANSGLNAGSIVSNSDNLTIEGGNLNATDIDITTDNLVVTSLQDTGQSSSKSSGGSVGFGSSNNVGINASQSNADSAWVNQQSGITGGIVNITAKDTALTGAVIAAVDDKGNSTDKLTLSTDTLTVADLQDSDNSKSMGIDLSLSKNTTKVGGSFNGHEKDQTTKATVGLGNVTVGGLSIEESIDEQPEFANLNREAGNSQEITKDMERGGVDISLTVDNRMLTEKGRNEVKKDFVDTQMHAGEIAQAVDDVVNTDLGITDAYGQVQKYATDRELLVQKAMDEEAQKALRGENGAKGSENAIQTLSDELSAKDGLAERTDIVLYDGSQVADDRVVNSTNDFNKKLALAGYHAEGGNTVYLNIDKTNMTDSSNVIKSTLHEQERHRLAQTGSTLNATDQTTLSTNRGDQSQKVWNAYSGLAGISTQSTTTQSAWNMVNAGRTNVAAGTAQIQTVNSEEVKPFAYALPLIFTAEATTVTAGGAAVGASAVVASYSKGPVETVLDFAAGFFSSKPTPLNGQNNRYNSTGGSQAYNSGPTRYSTPRVSHTSSNTETSILDIFGLGAVFSTSKEDAARLGYKNRIPPQKTGFDTHGQPAYANGKGYISPDADGHNGTDNWKKFNRKGDRTGTWNSDLTEKIKD